MEQDGDDFLYGGFEETRQEYLHGACWTFAVALHELTGWPLAWVRDGSKCTEWPMPVHGFCVHPSGAYVDAAGFVTAETFRARYGIPQPAVSDASVGQFDAICGLEDDEVDMTKDFIRAMTEPPFDAIGREPAPAP